MRKQDPNEICLYESLSNEIPNFKRRKLSRSRLKQILFVIENLEGFNKPFFGPHILTDLIEFGYWLKTDRTYGSINRKGMGNSSVMTYLSIIIAHLKDHYFLSITKAKLSKEFPFSEEKPSLDEDIVEAILDTELLNTKYKHVLDAIKLVLLHGFRYSDLWVLRKKACIFETVDKIQYFKYYPPKNHNSANNRDRGVMVPVHPRAIKIIQYWSDLKTESAWNASRVPKSFFDRKLSPHLKYVESSVIQPYFIFPDPIIKIPHHLLDITVKRQIFTEVHKTWCIRKFGNNWPEHFGDQVGLFEYVPHNGSMKQVYETLGYHTFRHVYCSRYLAKGGNVMDLRDNVGHSSIAVTQKYAHSGHVDRMKRAINII